MKKEAGDQEKTERKNKLPAILVVGEFQFEETQARLERATSGFELMLTTNREEAVPAARVHKKRLCLVIAFTSTYNIPSTELLIKELRKHGIKCPVVGIAYAAVRQDVLKTVGCSEVIPELKIDTGLVEFIAITFPRIVTSWGKLSVERKLETRPVTLEEAVARMRMMEGPSAVRGSIL